MNSTFRLDEDRIRGLASRAIAEGRSALTELEGMEVLEAMGLATPRRVLVRSADEAGSLAIGFPGAKIVVKVVSSAILHKTEVGGVMMARNAPGEVAAAVAKLESRFAGLEIEGFSLNEFVPFEPSLGREILAGFRLAPDFGPVVSLGFGGIYAEFLGQVLPRGRRDRIPLAGHRGEGAHRAGAVAQRAAEPLRRPPRDGAGHRIRRHRRPRDGLRPRGPGPGRGPGSWSSRSIPSR